MNSSQEVNMTAHDGAVSVATDPMSNVLSVAKAMHWYSSVVAGTIFLIIGLIGNVLSIIVWSRKSLRSSTGTYLIAQAVADISLLVLFYLTDSILMINPELKKDYAYGTFFAYIGYPIFFLAIIISIWMTVGVTVDRYIMVCWIGQSKMMCNIKRALHGICIIVVLCFIINVPHFFTYRPNTDRNVTENAFIQTEYGKGHGSLNYEFWVHCMFLVLVPVGTIFTLNVLIIREVVRTGAKMSDKKSIDAKKKSKKTENQLTTILLTVTFTFLILIALQCVTQCFFMLKPKIVNYELVDEAFAVAKLGIVINSSINFFLYCLSGRRFRQELRALFNRRALYGISIDSSSSGTTSTKSSKF